MKRLRAALFAAVTTLALLALAEAACRARLGPAEPDPGAPLPGQEFMLSVGRLAGGRAEATIRLGPKGELSFPNRTFTNRYGIRGPEFDWDKAPGGRRLVAAGDSVAFGYGVSDGATYADLLRERLALRTDLGRWETINAGFSGFTSAQVLAYWRARLRSLRPDALLVSTCPNDQSDWRRLVGDGAPMTDAELIRMYEARRAPAGRLLAESGLARALARAVLPLKKAWRERATPEEARRRVPLPEYEANLRALAAEATEAGARVFWLQSGCHGPYAEAFRRIAEETGGGFLDVHGYCEPERARLTTEEPYASLANFYVREYGVDPQRFNGGKLCTLDGVHLSVLGSLVAAEKVEAWVASWAAAPP